MSEDQILGLSDDQLKDVAGGFLLPPMLLRLLPLLPEEPDNSGDL